MYETEDEFPEHLGELVFAIDVLMNLKDDLIDSTKVMHGRLVTIEELDDLIYDWLKYYEDLDIQESLHIEVDLDKDTGSPTISLVGKTDDGIQAILDYLNFFVEEYEIEDYEVDGEYYDD